MNVSPSSTTRISRTQQAVTTNTAAHSAPASRAAAANPMQHPAAVQRLADIHLLDQLQTHISVTTLENWAKPNLKDRSDSMFACVERTIIVKALLKKQHNGTVSVPALRQDVAEVLRQLSEDIVQSSKKLFEGRTPAHIAARKRHSDCLTLLIHAGVNLNKVEDGGDTPALVAAGFGNTYFLILLHRAGVDLRLETPRGTPLSIAEENGHTETADTIRALLKTSPALALVMHQSAPVTPALLSQTVADINTLHDLGIALQLVSNGLGLGDIELNDDTRHVINEFFWAVINHTDTKDQSTMQGIYGFAAHVYQAKAMSEFHFGSIENHLKTNVRLNHLEQDVMQIQQVFTQHALQIRDYVQQLNQHIRALSDAVAQQNTQITQLNAGQQQIADKMLQIGQSLRTARQIGTLTKVASSVVSLAPVVGAFVGGLFEAGFKLQGLAKAKSFVQGLAAFKEQVANVDMPENVQALTLGMIIPELAEHEACAALANTPLKTLIETAGTTAQTYYENQMEKIALSVNVQTATETETPATTNMTPTTAAPDLPAEPVTDSNPLTSSTATASTNPASTQNPTAPLPQPAQSPTASSSAAQDPAQTTAQTPAPTLSRQDSGLFQADGNDNRLAASIKANNPRIFARELRKAIAADALNTEVQRSVNVDIHSTVLDIAAHYGRLDMAEAIEEAGGLSLRHGDPIRALRIAERHVGQYDDLGEKLEA